MRRAAQRQEKTRFAGTPPRRPRLRVAWLSPRRPSRRRLGLAVVIVSLGGRGRTKHQILAGDSRDPMDGIERSKDAHESAAGIG
jgi:hypothetical protein